MNANVNPEILGMSAATMGKDLLGFLVQEMKAMPDVWQKLPERRQNEVIERAMKRVESVVANAVHLIMSEGRTAIVADLEGIAIKDEIKATFKISKGNPHDARNELFENVSHACLIVISNPQAFTGGMDEVKPDPDQAPLDLSSDDDSMDGEFEEIGAPVEPHDGDASTDPVYDRAKELVISEQRPVASFLVEMLGIDEDRAVALIERMEAEHIVSAKDANGARTVLIDAPDTGEDPLYQQAVNWVVENQIATISHLQRHLKIGFNRAARLIDQMEKDGIVSPMRSNGVRDVLSKPNEGSDLE